MEYLSGFDFNIITTEEELKVFHAIDRKVYARLLRGHDPNRSKKLVAFWYYLDQEARFQFMWQISLYAEEDHDEFFRGLVAESIAFLRYLYIGQVVTSALLFPTMSLLLGDGGSLLGKVLGNKVSIDEAKKTLADNEKRLERAFSDIESVKTLFLTFSRGHPISDQELRWFFHSEFGDCVEAIHRQVNAQPLCAQVQCKSANDVRNILGDALSRQFSVHGKDVRMRRFTEDKAAANKHQQERKGRDHRRTKINY